MRLTIGVAATAIAVTVGVANAACDAGELEIRFHHTAAERGNARGEAALTLAERINRDLDGRACMSVRSRAEDHTEETLIDALTEGRFEMGAAATGGLGSVSVRYLVFDLPFLFDDVPAVLGFQASDTGRELLDEALPAGIRGLGFVLDGFNQIAANRRVIAPEDLTGLRFRITGSELDRATLVTLGAEPDTGEEIALADALNEGRIDATDGSWSSLRSNGIAGIAAAMTETNHTVQQFMLVAATDFWDGLEPGLRGDLEQLILEVAHERNRLSFELNEAAKFAMLGRGLDIVDLDPSQRLVWKRAMQVVWFEYGGDIGFDQISTALHANRVY